MRALYDLRLNKKNKIILVRKRHLNMQCNNKKIGCYHDSSIHGDGNGKCLVRGCKCMEFKS